MGNRKLAYFPDTGEDVFKITKYIDRTPEKPEITNKIIYLDFETFVQGERRITAEPEPFIYQYELPDRCYQPYTPYPFIERQRLTYNYTYTQTVNYPEAQYADGTSFVFKDIQQTMNWLAQPQNKGAIVLSHCGGSFDFQMIYKFFLGEEVLRLKKA